ncbi:GGDEF domain-containing protein [Kutzneria viridogrisea]|uniref:Diguanylate cyclase (GGDEF)-like protein n=1 Tax=Kutzneria viridogrisea TaxID=47990 RepID=A0ABR6BSG3_9PSEU|nr:diguanylate cyclase (GGDEF)-like protein [Kutzneria viridogrisea]
MVDHYEETAPALAEMSDAWLVGRARELAISCSGETDRASQEAIEEVDRLLAEAQRRGEPRMVAQLLRTSCLARLTSPALANETDPLLDEMITHTRRHGLTVMEAGAHALRGRRLFLGGFEDEALTAAAKALAILDEDLTPDSLVNLRVWKRMLATVLVDIGQLLSQLGVYEIAAQQLVRAQSNIRDYGGPFEISEHMINRTRLLLGWGLRLERVGLYDRAAEKFATASAIAAAAEVPWRESQPQRRSAEPAADQLPVVGAAHALARPGAEHIARLRSLGRITHYPRELIMVAIALARCYEREERFEEAVRTLGDAADRLLHDTSETTLRLCLMREFARLSGPESTEVGANALEQYATELEHEMWSMGESKVTSLQTRREHERLSREHGTISQQALQDPLTGLPNRRALDERLESLVAAPGEHPLSVALVDLDGFKGVNDRASHAEGDDVLRVIASTLRNAVRGDDMVARYGGDEFVVLLPGAPLSAAEAALGRAVDAVARLPIDLSRGVTLSIGVISLRPQETAAQALARADAAMYLAKRGGGNGVAAVAGDTLAEPLGGVGVAVDEAP